MPFCQRENPLKYPFKIPLDLRAQINYLTGSLYRFNPNGEEGKKFTWETKPATADYEEFIKGEVRYSSLYKTNPEHADELFAKAAVDAKERLEFYQRCGEVLGEIL